ncbi:DUF6216 family protein [Cedecea sp.]|jgi:hypothetical protein|uniref:DUF6216 family protein n=1 Tax=Cedecea sp. TaxID=1970739 RepID=UPI002F3E24AB
MNDLNPVAFNMFSSEFLNAPLGTIVASITILVFLLKPLFKLKNKILKYKKGHSHILKNAGVPAFILNFFMISIPLKELPFVGRMEKVVAATMVMLFVAGTGYLAPELVRTARTPPESALLYWKSTGDMFFISNDKAADASLTSPPQWEITRQNCVAKKYSEGAVKSLSHQRIDDLCNLFSTQEGNRYLISAVAKFKKDKWFIYSMVPFVEFVLLWMAAGIVFNIYYSKKTRRYILLEQKKAIEYAMGHFPKSGTYAVYLEVDASPAKNRRTHYY